MGRGDKSPRERHERSPRERRERRRSQSRSRSPRRKQRRSRSHSRERRRRSRSRSRSRSHSRSRERRRERLPPQGDLQPPPPPPPPLPPGWRGGMPPGQRPPPVAEVPPSVGSIHQASVESVRPFGVFVRLPGTVRHGLVSCNAVSDDMRFSREDADEDKLKALEWACPRGGRVFVKVTQISDDPRGGFRIACAMNLVDQESGCDLDPGGSRAGPGAGAGAGAASEEAPALGSVLRGSVADIKPYGLFVQLQGYRRNGLVHSSQVSEHMGFTREDADEDKVAALAGVVSVGEAVWVKVVELEAGPEGRTKVGCSMRLVNQSSGADLDPTGTHYRPRGQRDGAGGEEGVPGRREAGVRPNGLVDWGHHRADVRQAGGEAYDLVPSDEERVPDDRLLPGTHADAHTSRMVTSASRMQAVGGGLLPPGMLPEEDAPPVTISSVEEAQAILERYQRKASKRDGKERKKAAKKERKRERKEAKRSKSHKKEGRRSASSSSDS